MRRLFLVFLLLLSITGMVFGSGQTPNLQQDEATEADEDVLPLVEDFITSMILEPVSEGAVLVLFGQVLDVNGVPIPDAVVEIWQTDAGGIYNHPGDPSFANRDETFEGFGFTATNEDGWYFFRTVTPEQYGVGNNTRPRHIHYKVKLDEANLLTSQFYFSDDIAEVETEGMFQAVGESGDLLLLQLVQCNDDVILANGQIVVNTGIDNGELPLTPAQGEGPYYPVLPMEDSDNDLTIVGIPAVEAMPEATEVMEAEDDAMMEPVCTAVAGEDAENNN